METGVVSMTTGITNLMSIASTVLTTITSNDTLMTFFVAGLAFTAIAVVRKLRK